MRAAGMATAASAALRQSSSRAQTRSNLFQSMRKASSASDLEIISTEQRDDLVHDFSAQLVIETAQCEKLATDYTWISKTMTLTTENLVFVGGEAEKAAPDYVPLHEIVSVRVSTHVQDHITRDGDDHGDMTSHHSSRASAHESRLSSISRTGSLNKLKGKSASFNQNSQKHCTAFDVITEVEGVTCGRTYTVKMENAQLCEEWIQNLNKHSQRRVLEVTNLTTLQSLRKKAKTVYNSFPCQLCVALVILFNFVMNAIQAEYEPLSLRDKSEASSIFEVVDVGLTCFFCAELAFNLFGHWFWDFFLDGWSVFDLIVVAVSVAALALENVPGVNILRVLRAFRILRLIKRFDSLRQIMNAIIHSIIPVLNALLIGMMVTTIYTIIGVYLFAALSEESFGTFGRAMYTLFELTAFTIWPGSLPAFKDKGGKLLMEKDVVIFVVSFVAVVVWTLLQVVVAVLLDNFMCATAEDKAQKARVMRAAVKKIGGVFDPLLYKLSKTVDTEKELSGNVQMVWHVIDHDRAGRASFAQVREGLLKLNLTPRVRLTEEDFASVTDGYTICDEDGMVSAEAFKLIINRQLGIYVQRQLSDAVALCNGNTEGEALLQGLRQVLMVQSAAAGPGRDDDHSPLVRTHSTADPGSASPHSKPHNNGGAGAGGGVVKRLAGLEESVWQLKSELAELRRGQEEGFRRMQSAIMEAMHGVPPDPRASPQSEEPVGVYGAGVANGGRSTGRRTLPDDEGVYEGATAVPNVKVSGEGALFADFVSKHPSPAKVPSGSMFGDSNGGRNGGHSAFRL